jgi:hypothetical protein
MSITPSPPSPSSPAPGMGVREFFRAEIAANTYREVKAEQASVASEHVCRFQASSLGCPHISNASDVQAVVAMAKDDFDTW